MKKRFPRRKRPSRIVETAGSRFRNTYIFLAHNLMQALQGRQLGNCLELLLSILDPDEQAELTQQVAERPRRAQSTRPVKGEQRTLADILAANAPNMGLMYYDLRSNAVAFVLRQLDSGNVKPESASDSPFICALSEKLNLAEADGRLLFFQAIIQSTSLLHWMQMESNSVADYQVLFSMMTGIPENTVHAALLPNSMLLRTNLIHEGSDRFEMPDEAVRAVRGDMSFEEYQQANFLPDDHAAYDLDSFDLENGQASLMVRLLKSVENCQLLFYGKPGAGKTELARSLAQAAGLKPLLVPPRIEGSHESRLNRVHYASYFAAGSVLIVDEADNILNTESSFFALKGNSTPSKSLLNTFLDQARARIIWIVNDYDEIHESALRRFHYKLRFEKLSQRQRENATQLILAKHNLGQLAAENYLQDATKDEYITPGILDKVVQTYRVLSERDPSANPREIIPQLLSSHRPEKNEASQFSERDEKYDFGVLNTSGSPDNILQTVKGFYAHEVRRGGGINFLLHGLPGTGKTEFVKHVARECGRDVLFRRGSDLLGPFLGQTEHLIAQSFRDAERHGQILLVDEADTFFLPRESAQRSWEVSHTNEFLNQMENHRILLFCCTNLIDRLDSASMRRFHFKMEFRPLAAEQRTRFFLRYFADLLRDEPEPRELEQKLTPLKNLTPGDFRAVRQRYSYSPAKSLAWYDLLRELEAEVSYKPSGKVRPIGFT
jgi:SpoVK/Ycf46/Vps4 family AAA+-type ATPase